MEQNLEWEQLGQTLKICVSPQHKFGTDAFLLSDFAARAGEVRGSLRGKIACDLGTGCGIIPLLWFRGDRAPKQVWCVDIQPQAIRQLEITLAHHREQMATPDLSGVLPVLADLKNLGRQGAAIPPSSCDLVCCNPPYKQIDTGIMSQTAADQAARHETLCTVEDVCASAARLLKFGGRFCLCQRPERLADVMQAMRRHHLEPKRLRFVQQRPDTAPWLFLIEGKLGSKPFLQVEAPVIIEDAGGGFSPELLRIYHKKTNLAQGR